MNPSIEIGLSDKHFPSRTTWSYLLLRNEQIRSKTWPETTYDLCLWRRQVWLTLPEALDISQATVRTSTD